MQLPTEILSLIFRYIERYIYFAKQNKLICTLFLHHALNDKCINVELNGNNVHFLGINIFISVKKIVNEIVTNDRVQRYYKIEIYNTAKLISLLEIHPNKNVIIEQFKCKKTIKPFEKWEKIVF